jgi:hypothetical protein
MVLFSDFLVRGWMVDEALIHEPNPCPARRAYDVALRWVDGEWR